MQPSLAAITANEIEALTLAYTMPLEAHWLKLSRSGGDFAFDPAESE